MNILFPNIFSDSILLIAKIMIIISLVVYTLFAFILISQIKNSQQTVTTEFGHFLKALSYVHFALSIGLIIVAFIVL